MLRTGVDKAVAGALAGARVWHCDTTSAGSAPAAASTCAPGWMTGARAALGWLAARAGGLPLLAFGHSEGAWYAAELAADHAVAGAVLLAGGARPAEEILSWQTEMVAARLPTAARMILKITRTDIIGTQRKRVARIKSSTVTSSGSRASGSTPAGARLPRLRPAPGAGPHHGSVLAITGGRMFRYRRRTWRRPAASPRGPSKATWPATSATCSAPTPPRPGRGPTAVRSASQSTRKFSSS